MGEGKTYSLVTAIPSMLKGGCTMDILKKIFPMSFKFLNSVVDLIIGVLLHFIVACVLGGLISILAAIPVVSLIVAILGGLLDLYVVAGIVILLLAYFKVLKD